MALVDSTLMGEFVRRAAESTRLFHGRGWVFDSINSWLAGGGNGGGEGDRFYLLTGEPGSGKSAIAGRLFQFSRADEPAPNDLEQLRPGFLSAVHFCSARDSNLVDPHAFANSLAHQLTDRYKEFAAALMSVSEKTVYNVTQNVGTVEAGATLEATGYNIGSVNLAGLSPRDAFNRTVLTPLRRMYEGGFDEPITILVDALDESLSRDSGPSILDLISHVGSAPRKVRFILTSRNDARVVGELLDATRLSISDGENNDLNRKDINDYAAWRLAHDGRLAADAGGTGGGGPRELAAQLEERAGGNFLYIKFLLDAIAQERLSPDALGDLPAGLDKLYFDSLQRVVKLGNKSWGSDYAPLLGVLAVAREPLSFEQLLSFLDTSESALDERLNDLQQFLEGGATGGGGDDGAGEAGGAQYRLYHQSVVDFLRRPTISDGGGQIKNSYHLRLVEWHRRVADLYLKESPPDWDAFDDYGLRHLATHLAETVHVAPSTPAQKVERHRQARLLARVVADPNFQEAHLARVKDLTALQRDVEQALRSAASEDHRESPLLVAETALALVTFRRERLRPKQVFNLARRGEVGEAERQLGLYSVEAEWLSASRMLIAWLASHANPPAARELLDRVRQTPLNDPNLRVLMERTEAAFRGEERNYPLPPPPPAAVVAELVKRFGGLDANVEMLLGYASGAPAQGNAGTGYGGDPLFYRDVNMTKEEIGYVAERDGPLLVAFAAAHPVEGTGFLNDYLSVHTNYNYAHYRNRSLWALLGSVLRHPQQAWVEEMLPAMASTALAGSSLEFQEALPLAILGLRAKAGDADASRQFDEAAQAAVEEAQQLEGSRQRGDTWGSHKRRLAALAEVFSVLLDRRADALRLLDLAARLPYGFAGFQSPTCLTLTEAARVCRPDNGSLHEATLRAAQRAAHNVQDATYCVRVTSRFNAMSRRWWPAPNTPSPDIASVVERFVRRPSDPEFATVHVVGETYEHRSSQSELPLPPHVREARTLAELAKVYQRPLADFQRLNQAYGWAVDEPLPDGAEVNVPDPGFATQLAARFAAEILADENLDDVTRVNLVRPLVPLAAANSTAVDCVLSRLLLAARPADATSLANLEQVARAAQQSAATSVVQVNELMIN
ncbi:MAG TPA: hypothetical protein VJ866_13010 [Pyrinomonadaceae bacterium]|nr:hypothetical protein [Pyrinomonadaceae bacterium]